ncbi:DASH complex subunit Spc34 [Geosmithia morbida]|uniref:DASH complex subunit SPC34 n=1 Tax=Geosmithia morbida TaxID=1094350 RepID=A0A9P4Z2Q5_9HYPO|nr:DASH complex subunit Spc34 [Geosmithia morbida]KAF4126148.1 DASH complex subunit Spc34 [Geosmithia morbida]
MSLLASHLDQIGYSSQGIDSLHFPPPKMFTNALLANHEITSLIRDTESHERALFSVPAPPPAPTTKPTHQLDAAGDPSGRNSKRRRTVFNVASGEVTTGGGSSSARLGGGSVPPPRRQAAVAAVLGGEMHEKLMRRGGATAGSGRDVDVDVDVLLRGAEKLCGVYELPGARERIGQLRARNRAARSTMAYYETKVAEQAERLASYNKDWMDGNDDDDDGDDEKEDEDEQDVWTEQDLRTEEEEARELEGKKRELQARLRAMEKDIGGLMSM